ncbi:hypothetical protein JRO89_XS10G0077000 [Xanthoceras sorbifolium]|uniref:Uncharacterized protein n=1 Tax=Xanthoceras sorbifolium TaxID=99658 RepID=A0ABQ8HI09_9ROSI|nr:hypothetical protein JRO89_XS10G0077000 [Xanthoceras sorbifolium]
MLNICLTPESPLLPTTFTGINSSSWRRRRQRKKPSTLLQVSADSYQDFIHFALKETQRHTVLVPSPLQGGRLVAYCPDVSINVGLNNSLQVLDFAVFPKPEFDLPIFCANFFTTANKNIVVL